MKRLPLSTVVIAVLVLTNLVTGGFLIKAYMWDQRWLRVELDVEAATSGAMMAKNDFRNGTLRLFTLTPADNGTIADTGKRDGAFEVWTWAYVPGLPGSREAAERFVDMYNSTMRHMHEHPDIEGVAHH